MKNGDNVNNQELKIIMSTNACWHCYYTANKKEKQFLMKCIRNDSFQIYTERAEQVEWEKMVAAMLYS